MCGSKNRWGVGCVNWQCAGSQVRSNSSSATRKAEGSRSRGGDSPIRKLRRPFKLEAAKAMEKNRCGEGLHGGMMIEKYIITCRYYTRNPVLMCLLLLAIEWWLQFPNPVLFPDGVVNLIILAGVKVVYNFVGGWYPGERPYNAVRVQRNHQDDWLHTCPLELCCCCFCRLYFDVSYF